MRALSIAATGMLAQQTNVEVIANNLANMNTTAYKSQRAEFQDLLYENIERPGAASADTGSVLPSGIQIGVGVRTAATYRLTSQGNLAQTSNPYDLAINGKGYFHVMMPDSTDAYTRAGAFSLSPDGQIVTEKGYIVIPGIAIPPDAISVTINAVGQVQALIGGRERPADAGPARARAVSQRLRPSGHRRQSVHRVAGFRRRADRASGRTRLRHAPAGLPRNLECERGPGDHRSDHRAARL